MPREPSSSGHARLPGPLALPNDDPRKILAVAVLLCLVCSVMVSSAAVLLKPLQKRNQALAVKSEIVKVSGLHTEGADVEALFEQIETRIVNLDTGEYADDIDPASFDALAAAKDPDTSIALSSADDIARIKRRALYAPVYLVRKDGRLETLILPVYGKGLWSTMQGFLALAGDGKTILGLTFYEQGETPGLGDEIVSPQWQQQFKGKSAFDETGQPRVHLVKGTVQESSPEAKYQVDGIAGATLTSNGVTNLLQYWLSSTGFGPYLKRLQSSGGKA
jgi:Na+-transporting NADH:ubiquinone oxidoreductase subunit C